MKRDAIEIRGEVAEALAAGAPVVALESTLISHGLPRPDNLRVASKAEKIVRDEGAVPTTIGVVSGAPKLGLKAEELELLATAEDIPKLSTRDLPIATVKKSHPATNVAAWLARTSPEIETPFIGRVGDDMFGEFLAEELGRDGVVGHLGRDAMRPTGKVFVLVNGEGEWTMIT